METKKVTGGTQGSWLAKVDNTLLPCVHNFWCSGAGNSMLYNDRLLKPSPANEKFVAEIKEAKRVILTRSIPYSESNPIPFKREGYIALFAIGNVEFDDDGLRFLFIKRLCELT